MKLVIGNVIEETVNVSKQVNLEEDSDVVQEQLDHQNQKLLKDPTTVSRGKRQMTLDPPDKSAPWIRRKRRGVELENEMSRLKNKKGCPDEE
ncbi:hypothetical protein TNCV_905181 [Trichonephila clavipes]|nr:hypothetical protein TNCV_905181 [Trichonephila clavipes]